MENQSKNIEQLSSFLEGEQIKQYEDIDYSSNKQQNEEVKNELLQQKTELKIDNKNQEIVQKQFESCQQSQQNNEINKQLEFVQQQDIEETIFDQNQKMIEHIEENFQKLQIIQEQYNLNQEADLIRQARMRDIDLQKLILAKCDKLQRDLNNNQQIKILIFGPYSSGKSSFINSLIGRDVLPVSINVQSQTFLPIEYINKFSDEKADLILVEVTKIKQSEKKEIITNNFKEIHKLLQENDMAVNKKKYILQCNINLFGNKDSSIQNKMVIIDSPGFKSQNIQEWTKEYCKDQQFSSFDFVIFVLDPLTLEQEAIIETIKQFQQLKDIQNLIQNQRMFVILNKFDLIYNEIDIDQDDDFASYQVELEQQQTQFKKIILEKIFPGMKERNISCVSSRDALLSKIFTNPNLTTEEIQQFGESYFHNIFGSLRQKKINNLLQEFKDQVYFETNFYKQSQLQDFGDQFYEQALRKLQTYLAYEICELEKVAKNNFIDTILNECKNTKNKEVEVTNKIYEITSMKFDLKNFQAQQFQSQFSGIMNELHEEFTIVCTNFNVNQQQLGQAKNKIEILREAYQLQEKIEEKFEKALNSQINFLLEHFFNFLGIDQVKFKNQIKHFKEYQFMKIRLFAENNFLQELNNPNSQTLIDMLTNIYNFIGYKSKLGLAISIASLGITALLGFAIYKTISKFEQANAQQLPKKIQDGFLELLKITKKVYEDQFKALIFDLYMLLTKIIKLK